MPWAGRNAYRKPIVIAAPAIEIRRARAQDAQACARLQLTDADAPPLNDRAAAMVRSLERPDRWLWVACAGSAVIGFARLAALVPAEPHSAPPAGLYLGGVSVAPERRRQGAGWALTRVRLEHAFSDPDVDRVWYFANARNEASIQLHAGFGFEEFERPMRFAPVSFTGGVGVLFSLSREAWAAGRVPA
ncbi:MAG: GNAT family protein [Solirubrobacteraceae bacterium]